VSGRSRDWLKVKCQRRGDFVVGGYTAPQGSRSHFGALHLGLYDEGKLVYVSKVGTGFDEARLTDIAARLAPLERDTSPFATRTPAGRGQRWVGPLFLAGGRLTDLTAHRGGRGPAPPTRAAGAPPR